MSIYSVSQELDQQIYVGVSFYLRNLSTEGQTDRQTHGRGYMYLAQSVYIVYCKAGDLCWRLYLKNMSRQTDRHTDVAICTWLSLYVVRQLLVCAGCGHPGLADGVIGGERQPQTSVETVDPRLINVHAACTA